MQRRTLYVRANATSTVIVDAETALDATTVIDLREFDVDAVGDDRTTAAAATMPAVSAQPTVR